VKNMSTTLMPYETSGPESSYPIVLLHGGLSGWISWKPHAEILSKNYRVMRVQLLNMAAAEKNETPGEEYSLRSETEALKNTLDKLNMEKVNLVGWSHGGEMSLDFALNYPGRIKTLTLIEPAAYWVARGYGQFQEENLRFLGFINGIHSPVTEEDLIKFLTCEEASSGHGEHSSG